MLDRFALDGRQFVVTGASSGIGRAMAGFLAAGGALGALDWIEQRLLAAGAEAFAELLQGMCAAPKVVLRTAD